MLYRINHSQTDTEQECFFIHLAVAMIVFILCICAVRIKIGMAVFGKCYCIWKFTAWANITEQNICQYIPAFHSTVEGEDNCRNIFPLIDQDRTASDNGNDSIRIHTLYTRIRSISL